MNKRAIPLVTLIVVVGLVPAALPAFGAPPPATPVSGLECVYILQPGESEITGQMMHTRGRVHQNYFYSDDPAVFPDAANTTVLDIALNLKTGIGVMNVTAVYEPEGVDGTFEGTGVGWLKLDLGTGAGLDMRGQGVFHGTGDLEGLTLKLDLHPGDITQCPGTPFDAGWWQGFIVPPDP